MLRNICDETVVSALHACGFTCSPQTVYERGSLFAYPLLYETDFSGGMPYVFPDGRVLLDNGSMLYWRIWLLLISCSASKRQDGGLLPAMERYTGIVYDLVRQARREGAWPAGVRVQIVSAEYGLIDENFLLPFYDRLMTEERGRELQPTVGARLDALLRKTPVQEVYINMGKNYRLTLAASHEITRLCKEGRVRVAPGGIGVKRKSTREWLYSLHAMEMAECISKIRRTLPFCAPFDHTAHDCSLFRLTSDLERDGTQ